MLRKQITHCRIQRLPQRIITIVMIGSAHDYVVSAQKQDTVPMVVYGDCWLLRIEEGFRRTASNGRHLALSTPSVCPWCVAF